MALKLPANSSLKFHREQINSWICRDVLETCTHLLGKPPIPLNPAVLSFCSPHPPSLSPTRPLLSQTLSFLRSSCAKLPYGCQQTIWGCFEKVIARFSSRCRDFSGLAPGNRASSRTSAAPNLPDRQAHLARIPELPHDRDYTSQSERSPPLIPYRVN